MCIPSLLPIHTVTLYNCSMGREDCSLCKNADPKYRCVWCVKQKACVYEKLCSTQGSGNPNDIECPDPQITGVSIYIVISSLHWHLNRGQYVFPIPVISSEQTLTGDWLMYWSNGFLLFLLMDELKVCFSLRVCWPDLQLNIHILDGINSLFTLLEPDLSLTKINQQLC